MSLFSDTRASSISFEYVLTLSVGLALLSGLAVGVNATQDFQKKQIAEEQLDLVGNQVSAQLLELYTAHQHTTDSQQFLNHLGESTTQPELSAYVDTPSQITGETYIVRYSAGDNAIVVTTTESRHQVTTPIHEEVPIKNGTSTSGSDVKISYDGSSSQFEFTNT